MDELFDDMTIILKKKNPSRNLVAEKRKGNVVSVKKPTFATNKNNLDNRKLDESTDVESHVKVSLSLSKIISHTRTSKGFSQKKLAQLINEKPAIIIDYESSKGMPNPVILRKMEKHLKVKLLGKNIGEPID